MNETIFSRDGQKAICWPATCPNGTKPGDTIEALINGRRFSGKLVYVVACAYQSHAGHYLEYRCGTFACHAKEIVSYAH